MAIPLPPDRRRAATLRTALEYNGPWTEVHVDGLFGISTNGHAGSLLLEHPDRRRVQRLPATSQPLDQRLLGQAGDVHRHVVLASQLGREPDVLACERQIEAGRLP